MPVGPRCGDKAEYEYKVTSNLVGEYAQVTITRKNIRGATAVSVAQIKKTITNVVWPDLDIEGSWCGGRQFDSRGLNKKTYEDKFNEQQFQLEVTCANDRKESDDVIEIKAYDPKGPEEKKIGCPIPYREKKEIKIYNPAEDRMETYEIPHLVVPNEESAKEMSDKHNIGHFWIEFKDGEVILRVKLKIKPESDYVSEDKIFKEIKKSVESYWNDPGRGLRQWVYHRKDCVRGDKCNCSVFYKNTGDELELVAGGCCKVPVRLKIEKGDDNPVRVEFISPLEYGRLLEMKEEKPFEWSLPDYRAATKRFYYPENRFGTYAHEIGHMLGLPDQYPWQRGGKTSALPGILEIDSGSVMGSRKDGGKVPKEFVEYPKFIKEWITGNVDPSMEPKDK